MTRTLVSHGSIGSAMALEHMNNCNCSVGSFAHQASVCSVATQYSQKNDMSYNRSYLSGCQHLHNIQSASNASNISGVMNYSGMYKANDVLHMQTNRVAMHSLSSSTRMT